MTTTSSFPGMNLQDIAEALTGRELAVDSYDKDLVPLNSQILPDTLGVQSVTGFRARTLSDRFRTRYADAMGEDGDNN